MCKIITVQLLYQIGVSTDCRKVIGAVKMKMLTYPRGKFENDDIDLKIIKKLINKHGEEVDRFTKLKKYYLGEHDILNKKRLENQPNYKPVCNHAKDISDTATGYFIGNAIVYNDTNNNDLSVLLEAFDLAEVDEKDHDNAINMSIYGVAYELIYVCEGTNDLNIQELDVRNTFIVYDDSIEHRPLFAVYYNCVKDEEASEEYKDVYILTDMYKINVHIGNGKEKEINRVKHYLGDIPVIEYRNNKFCIGDFEQQIGLIDSYNSLMANRVNDKEQFINSLLIMYGAKLADGTDDAIRAMALLREAGLLELPRESKAEYISQTLEEESVETLKKALKNDIYTFSHVPNLTDENFAGNSSGVAMEYKLLGLEMITKTKQRYYTKGLKRRILMFANYLGIQSIKLNINSIVPQFSRGLPKNILEISQIISNLEGKVSTRQLISLLPFIEDPDAEIEALEKEKKNQRIEEWNFFQIQG